MQPERAPIGTSSAASGASGSVSVPVERPTSRATVVSPSHSAEQLDSFDVARCACIGMSIEMFTVLRPTYSRSNKNGFD